MASTLFGVSQDILQKIGIIDTEVILGEAQGMYGKFQAQWIAYQTEALKQKLREVGTSIETYEEDGYIVERKVWMDGQGIGRVSSIEFMIYKKNLVNAVQIAVKQPGIEQPS